MGGGEGNGSNAQRIGMRGMLCGVFVGKQGEHLPKLIDAPTALVTIESVDQYLKE